MSSAAEPPKGVPAEELDRVYHGPLEEFTDARNSLAKSLKEDGKTEAASWVKSLKKPTTAAWLVNQLPKRKPAVVKRLLETGEELRKGQEEMMAGATDPDALRETAAREQKEIDELVKTAEAIGREHGVGSQILDRVGETLQAASSDPEVAKAIELGRLDRERRAASLGLIGASAPAPSAGGRAKEKTEAADRRARQKLARERKDAQRKVSSAETRVERERDGVERAQEALADRERRLKEAEQDLRAANRELDSL